MGYSHGHQVPQSQYPNMEQAAMRTCYMSATPCVHAQITQLQKLQVFACAGGRPTISDLWGAVCQLQGRLRKAQMLPFSVVGGLLGYRWAQRQKTWQLQSSPSP